MCHNLYNFHFFVLSLGGDFLATAVATAVERKVHEETVIGFNLLCHDRVVKSDIG